MMVHEFLDYAKIMLVLPGPVPPDRLKALEIVYSGVLLSKKFDFGHISTLLKTNFRDEELAAIDSGHVSLPYPHCYFEYTGICDQGPMTWGVQVSKLGHNKLFTMLMVYQINGNFGFHPYSVVLERSEIVGQFGSVRINELSDYQVDRDMVSVMVQKDVDVVRFFLKILEAETTILVPRPAPVWPLAWCDRPELLEYCEVKTA